MTYHGDRRLMTATNQHRIRYQMRDRNEHTLGTTPPPDATLDHDPITPTDDLHLEEDELRDLSAAIVATRVKARLTRRQVADAMETNYRSISRLESGTHQPSIRSLQRFARITGTRLRVSFEDVPVPQPTQSAAPTKGFPSMPNDPRTFTTWRASRRTLLGAAAGAAATSSLLGRAAAQDATPNASPAADVPANGIQPDGTWVFTDDRGVTVILPKQPERIFADLSAAAPLWDFGIRPIAVSGWTTTTDVAWGNADRSLEDITISPDLGSPDPEKLIALQPDIYVNITWSKGDPNDVWGFSDIETYETINGIVPIVCIAATGFADENMLRFAELAGLLGADLETPEILAARETYEAAVASFSALATEKADVSSLFGYVMDGAEWYAATQADWADLAWFARLGLNIVDVPGEPGDFWETLSTEQAVTYPADVFFNSARAGTLSLEELAASPTFQQHPAVAAGQIGSWNQDFIMSYQGLTEALNGIAATIAASTRIL